MSAWSHDDVVTLLATETLMSRAEVEQAVTQLASLGWTPHQSRRGILIVVQTGLSMQALWQGHVLADCDLDLYLDALTPQ